MKNIYKLIISIAIPILVGAVAGYFTSSSVTGWFITLNKPSFNPPNWLFGPVWTALYILMGIAFYLVWRSEPVNATKKQAIILYIIQLTLNFCWSFIFFYKEAPGIAFAEILLLWIFILLTIIYFLKISKIAGWLMVPYLCWVTFAAILNYSIWQLN
ncbi:MAG: TspO/MBR family protein [Ferruginibacter sp.]